MSSNPLPISPALLSLFELTNLLPPDCIFFSVQRGKEFLIQTKLQEQQLLKAFRKNKGARDCQTLKAKQLGERDLKLINIGEALEHQRQKEQF